jgi:hypothetical protein
MGRLATDRTAAALLLPAVDDLGGTACRVVIVVGGDEAQHAVVNEDASDIAAGRVAPAQGQQLCGPSRLAAGYVD